MERREALRLGIRAGVSVGLLGGAALYGRHRLLPPPPSRELQPVDRLAVRLVDSLEPAVRDVACVEYDHPYRQYHNRGVGGGGIDIDGGVFSREQRSILTDLVYAGLSEPGRKRLPNQFFINWPGVHYMRLLICGDPRTPPYQIILSGPHLNLRLGGASREGAAFGGPMVYGDQRGDTKQGLPRNIYRYQFLKAHELFRGLEPDQQRDAVLARAPIQTQIEIQGMGGSFPGVGVAGLSTASKERLRGLIDAILSTYPDADVAYANRCIDENGGIDALYLSYYEEGEVNGSGEYQIFRLEGPTSVLYFRGYPHVHAFINICMDPERPLSVGEILGENPETLEREGVKRLFEAALKEQTGSDLAFCPSDSVVGRLRRGTIRTGDVYTLESWQNSVAIARIRGSEVGGLLRDELGRAGTVLDPDRVYTVATTDHVVRREASRSLGKIRSWDRDVMLRDAAIAYLERNGFPGRT